MPFKSKKQARFMFANKPEMAKEWAAETPSIKKLPDSLSSINSFMKKDKKKKTGGLK